MKRSNISIIFLLVVIVLLTVFSFSSKTSFKLEKSNKWGSNYIAALPTPMILAKRFHPDLSGVFLTKDTGLKNKLQREVNGYRQPVEVHCRSDT
jgi:hypothetical protein